MTEDFAVRSADAPAVLRGRMGTPASVASDVVGAGRRPTPRRGFDQPRFLAFFTAVVFVYLFAPIVVVTWFSFNSKRSLQVFGSPSLTWYSQFLNDPAIIGSLVAASRSPW